MPADIDLNPSLAANRAGIVMFDALNDYLHPSDPAKEANLRKWHIRENMARLIKGARDNGLTVFYASGDHAPRRRRYCDTADRYRHGASALERARPPV